MKKIIAFLLIFLMAFSFCACAKKETAEEAVTNALNAIIEMDSKTAEKYFGTDILSSAISDDSELYGKLIPQMMSKISFKVLDSEEEKDKASVNVELTTVDMASVTQEAIDRLISFQLGNLSLPVDQQPNDAQLHEQLVDTILELINVEDVKTVSVEVKIDLVKANGQWRLSYDNDFGDALTGGLINFVNSLN